ncbi:unnamed protein product [Prunus brigantina]
MFNMKPCKVPSVGRIGTGYRRSPSIGEYEPQQLGWPVWAFMDLSWHQMSESKSEYEHSPVVFNMDSSDNNQATNYGGAESNGTDLEILDEEHLVVPVEVVGTSHPISNSLQAATSECQWLSRKVGVFDVDLLVPNMLTN